MTVSFYIDLEDLSLFKLGHPCNISVSTGAILITLDIGDVKELMTDNGPNRYNYSQIQLTKQGRDKVLGVKIPC